MKKNKKAFTLAEVLVTISVLGIIASITMPSLIRRHNDRVTVTKVKLAYSVVSNGLRRAYVENRKYLPANNTDFYNVVIPYFNIETICDSNNIHRCFGAYQANKTFNINTFGRYFLSIDKRYVTDYVQGTPVFSDCSYKGIRLKNGISVAFCRQWMFNSSSGSKNSPVPYRPGYVLIDINGPKLPNRWGYDIFMFLLYCDGSMPVAKKLNAYDGYFSDFDCNVNTQKHGVTCGQWIIKNGNVNYKYKDVTSETTDW